jgi:alkanesulfonate monooxygenase SsuD/methylene tetrahydromethanopterin reductase-like flavin-dependent oxidoreductase (luciferase family)
MLAPGACTHSHAARYSLEHIDPPTTLREWVESMRLITTGDPATHEGKTVKIKDVQLGWKTRPNAHPLLPGGNEPHRAEAGRRAR